MSTKPKWTCCVFLEETFVTRLSPAPRFCLPSGSTEPSIVDSFWAEGSNALSSPQKQPPPLHLLPVTPKACVVGGGGVHFLLAEND